MPENLQGKLLLGGDENSEQDASDLADGAIRSVLVPYPVDKAYDYLVPKGVETKEGAYLTVPLGGRHVPGVIWGEAQGGVAKAKIKAAIESYDVPPMPKVHRDFIDWVARYTLSARGAVLKMAVSVPKALEEPKPFTVYQIADGKPPPQKGLSPQRKNVLAVMADGQSRRLSQVAEEAGCSAGVVKGLVDKGYLKTMGVRSAPPCTKPRFDGDVAVLSEGQAKAADFLKEAVSAKAFKTALLDGVTGAGKTEVYFQAVAQALKEGKQALIMLPEIALSNAFLDRFKKTFGCAPALWHSNLSDGVRQRTWRGVATGETKVIVGARSALFLPYQDLGLIIVDEEHDPAYKQEDGVLYHARDMAVIRAHLGHFPVVLVSATPSLETVQNVQAGRYHHLHLPDRFGGARLPDIHVIDMRENKPDRQHFISPPLKDAMIETLERGEQVLLFLNRRGYAPLTLCRTCGHRFECPRCTAWLVEHKNTGSLQCHHCGFGMRMPKACPECQDTGSLTPCGPGVERIYEEVKAGFPNARVLMLASDTADGDMTLRGMLEQIREQKVDIVIGTQIIAKGHHFPGLTMVGVVDADIGMQGGELRASERTYQLLHQVAGRAGREDKKGDVYIQTWFPENRIMMALADGARDEFLKVEALEREAAHMPPFSRLAGVIISGRDENKVKAIAMALGRSAPQGENIQTLGPAPAPLARLRGKYRYRLLVRADKTIDLQKAMKHWISQVKTPSTVRVVVDIDPQSFF